ncbi:hydrophobe/amphiphile efflux-1 (HAE1) family protein [Ancylobacter sp. 3268]|uniref:efflux RND transporter permease subunit n=1 Tax=Ancylobacter sp. 3268 TaxID=2817752 RepID=UPI00285B75DF|nr:multidrug efflux RND transporter permease subunit [Ancylobacter sp. 3268]MDR6954365.1 hydrophobe/amphiphile efflux-1 (HAE1) family protein [Ancylobacter sp. 3268]
MKFSHFFIDRPIFASVVSIVVMILGAVAYISLPVAQYPDIAPPVVNVTGQFPGASAETVADTVVSPIEQQINGVEGMLYISSNSTADGRFSIAVTFDIGTDLDIAQVQVQNRVATATPRLPQEVQQIGVTVAKSSPDILMVVSLFSPDDTRDSLFISNYANLQIKDQLQRVPGVGSITVFGSRDYAMQIWLDPQKLQALNLAPTDIIAALQAQNVQVASGVLNAPPVEKQLAFQVAVRTLGRLSTPEEFGNIVVRQSGAAVVRLRDVARIDIEGQDNSSISYFDSKPSVALGIFQLPGSNALSTGQAIEAEIKRIAESFPAGITYSTAYNPTQFIAESVRAVEHTIFEAIILVVIVVVLFLQSWRAAIIPILAIPVSLIGTFFIMSLFGFSLNNLSLFGLVLAIGIVVDDAIVVVESVEHNISTGLSPRDAAYKTMDEVGGALVAISLVLASVFIPSAFITGISGEFYRQFALTIAGSTLISLLVSLTLSPAMCALLLKAHDPDHKPAWYARPITGFFHYFNKGFNGLSHGYAWLTGRLMRFAVLVLIVYGAILAGGFEMFRSTPQGFIPAQDRGYLIVASQLPGGAALSRTNEVMTRAAKEVLATPGVAHVVNIVGFSGATFTNAPNAGAMFVILGPADERAKHPGQSAVAIQGALFGKLAAIQEAFMIVVMPPPVNGIGNAGGYRMMIEDRGGRGYDALQGAVYAMMGRANQTPGLKQVYSLFETSTPQLFLDIDRTKAQMLGINMADAFATLQTYIGSTYVNDFNLFGRTYRVQAQADAPHRLTPEDVLKLRVKNANGETVPFGSFATVRDISGPYRVPRYNLYPAAELDGDVAGISQGQAIQLMQQIAAETLPDGFSYEWTALAYQQVRAGNTAIFAFGLGVVFVFLVLAAQYESLTLPLAVILIVPMCLIAAVAGILIRGQDNNILSQVGFIVLIGLAAKNAILIVEFAKQLEDRGSSRFEAATQAAQLRLRPIIMTSLAFILGVVPLVIATGAGSELRQALGTAVFSGMIGVTFFGLLFTPTFYVVCRWLASFGEKRRARREEAKAAAANAAH